MDTQWFLGFVEGEGCFNVSFVKQRGNKFGYQPRAMFIIKLTQSEKDVIEQIRNFLGGIGNIYLESSESTRKSGLKNARDCVSIRITKLEELERIVELLKDETFVSKQKRYDFENWAKCIQLLKNKKHLEIEGFIEIARLRENMHTRKQVNKKGFCEIRNHVDLCDVYIKEQKIPESCNLCYACPQS